MFGTAERGRGIAKHPLGNLPVVFFFEAFPWIAGLEMQAATTLCLKRLPRQILFLRQRVSQWPQNWIQGDGFFPNDGKAGSLSDRIAEGAVTGLGSSLRAPAAGVARNLEPREGGAAICL